jgi:hypothetical protein
MYASAQVPQPHDANTGHMSALMVEHDKLSLHPSATAFNLPTTHESQSLA